MRRFLVLTALIATPLALTRSAQAQGFQVNEHGSCAMARAGTGVAKSCDDGSAMFYNPAGIVGPRGWIITAGVTVIDANGGFTTDLTGTKTDLMNSPIPVPHAYLQYGTDKFAVGAGMFVPYGLGTKWPDTFQGKFAGYDNSLQNIYIQPTVAWKPHRMVSIGAGVDYVIGSVTLTQRVDLSENPVPGLGAKTFGQLGVPSGTQFADGKLDGSGSAFAAHFGVVFTPDERFRIGVRYMTRANITYDGNVVFTPASTGITLPAGNPFGVPAGTPLDSVVSSAFVDGPLLNQTVSAKVTLPDQLTAGVAMDVAPTVTLLVDYSWVHWKLFQELPIDFATAPDITNVENYKNTWAIRFGLDWAVHPNLTLHGGYLYHTAASPAETVTPLLPEGKRNEFTGGLGYSFGQRFRVEAAYQYLAQQDRRGRTAEFPSGAVPTTALNNGLYEFNAHLFGLTLSAGF
jgi:long-chain fatty acid transport protein